MVETLRDVHRSAHFAERKHVDFVAILAARDAQAVKEDPANRSFGLQVAALAGLPKAMIAAARSIPMRCTG